MSRRFRLGSVILLVVIWAGVLLSPKLRLLFYAQRAPFREWIQLQQFERDNSLTRLHNAYPNDPRLSAVWIENRRSEETIENSMRAKLREYDALIAQFPREAWLIQNRLRLSAYGGLYVDAGEMIPPNQRENNNWLSKVELLQALKISELGARLEPQNSFYDWMRASFYFALKKPESALNALFEGTRKTNFNDGVLHDMNMQIQVHEMQGPLLWEERIEVLSGMFLPHYASIRKTNLAAVWQGVIAERKGNHQKALEIYGNQMDLAGTMRHNSSNLFSVLVADDILRRAWGGTNRKIKGSVTSVNSEQVTKELSLVFAEYSKRHGRPDLAQLALSQARNSDTESLRQSARLGSMIGAEKTYKMQNIGKFFWSGAVLLRAMLVLSCIWIVLTLISLVARDARVLPAPIDVTASLLFSLTTIASVFFMTLYRGINEPLYLELFGEDNNKDNLRIFTPYIETILTWLPLLLGISYCGVATLWRARKNPRKLEPPKNSVSTHERSAGDQIISGLSWSAILLGVLAFCYLMTAWAFWLLNLPGVLIDSPLIFFAPFGLVVALLYLWRRRKMHFHNWTYLVAWSRSTLGALIVIGSIIYLVTSLAALPLRSEANARLDDFLARGEVAVLRDMVQERK